MKIIDIFENSVVYTEQLIKDIIVMFMHNNNYSVSIDVIQKELRKNGVQVDIEYIQNVISEFGYDIVNGDVVFNNDEEQPEKVDFEDSDFITPAEQKAKEATRKALRGK